MLGDRPLPYVVAAAPLGVAATAALAAGAAGLGAALAVAALMLAAQALLLHRSAVHGEAREVERLRASLLLADGERLLDLRGEDLRSIAAPEAGADGVLAVRALQRTHVVADREAVARELARVVRPGGRIALLEARGTHDLVLALEDLGFEAVQRSGLRWAVWPPHRVVTARRAG